jgi:hypothetical protein
MCADPWQVVLVFLGGSVFGFAVGVVVFVRDR